MCVCHVCVMCVCVCVCARARDEGCAGGWAKCLRHVEKSEHTKVGLLDGSCGWVKVSNICFPFNLFILIFTLLVTWRVKWTRAVLLPASKQARPRIPSFRMRTFCLGQATGGRSRRRAERREGRSWWEFGQGRSERGGKREERKELKGEEGISLPWKG